MGQFFGRSTFNDDDYIRSRQMLRFRDLSTLPPELSFLILSNLNATDLSLAACVWQELACDDLLWKGLCLNSWPYCSAYKLNNDSEFSFRKLFLKLDEACLTFNADCFDGISYLFEHNIVENEPSEIAKFLHFTTRLNPEQKRRYLETRRDVLDDLMELKNFSNQFLANALRNFFTEISAPKERNNFLSLILERFSLQFVQCNPSLYLSSEMVYILCYSLIMLSVDLCSPQVKNKMSKREFIRNTRHATHLFDDDFLGDLYDNVYLLGHVASLAA